MMIKGVLFDLGNTLMYWNGDPKELNTLSDAALIAFLKRNDIAIGDDFIPVFREERKKGWALAEQEEMEYTVEQALQKTLARLGYSSLNGLLPNAVREFFVAGEKYQHAYPGTVEMLQALQQRGLRLGLVSNADDDALVQRAVANIGVAPYLDPIASSAGLRWRKPNPQIFRHVAQIWQLPPEQIVMVGDAPRYDILGAHRAGMRGILIDREEGHWWQAIPDELKNDPAVQPDAVVQHASEIPSAIERIQE